MPIDAPLSLAIAISLVVLVSLCAITDISEHRIPNIVLMPALILAFIFNSLLAGLPGLLDCFLGLLLGLGVLFPFYFVGGISAGDVKLLGVVGAFLGTNGAVTVAVATLGFAGVLGVLIIGWRVFAPQLSMYIAQFMHSGGSAVSPALGTAMPDRDSRSSAFPYAPAIACGTYFALWHLGYLSRFAVYPQ